MIHAVEGIVKEKVPIICIDFDGDRPLQEAEKKIQQAIEQLKNKEGILILTDLFGATPTNLCNRFCQRGKIEIVTGCNLPMVLKAATTPFTENVTKAAEFLKNYARDKILIFPESPLSK
jgi:PTS system mannose-specific IIA component